MGNIDKAAQRYADRKDRNEHPDGEFDNAGRWYPSDEERQPCCDYVRSPSRAYPYSYMTHCRTLKHVAQLEGVSEADLRKAARAQSAPTRPGPTCYKLVARTEDGRLVSIFDGETEYVIGETVSDRARQSHTGGIYVYETIEEALNAVFPPTSEAANLPRVLIEVDVDGAYCRYDNKLAFSRVTPKRIIETATSNAA